MKVFIDLVRELKEENLLEETVVDGEEDIDITDEPDLNGPARNDVPAVRYERLGGEAVDNATSDGDPERKPAIPRTQKQGREFFKKRAVAEVASLQMVEHVLTGVEHEYLKIVPKTFDDFNAKKALNGFLRISENSNSEEHKRAEFELMHETESWCSALAERDRNVPVSSLRQYCENSRPALSSQALLALGRFYRNLPYSEGVRAKFDFVITRLFSRPDENDRRSCLFSREEMVGHITTLYADWSSVPLYTADSNESNVVLTAISFEDLAGEAENAVSFDQLITSDFFGRVRFFKESISELFYAPSVTAAAIECNVRIGNAFVDLIQREHAKLDASSIQAKYGDVSDQSVSDAAGRTLDLAEIIRARTPNRDVVSKPDPDEYAVAAKRPLTVKAPKKAAEAPSKFTAGLVEQLKSVNKWVLITAATLLLLTGCLGIWANYYAEEPVSTSGVRGIELESSPLNEHLSSAKISGDTFYGLLRASWDLLSKEKRAEFLQKSLATAKQHGAKQVNLIGKDGKVAAYASDARTEVIP